MSLGTEFADLYLPYLHILELTRVTFDDPNTLYLFLHCNKSIKDLEINDKHPLDLLVEGDLPHLQCLCCQGSSWKDICLVRPPLHALDVELYERIRDRDGVLEVFQAVSGTLQTLDIFWLCWTSSRDCEDAIRRVLPGVSIRSTTRLGVPSAVVWR
ncbi:hypothetical protein JAAARDRAFT_48484 [Jaapia argillacea MUCL 33604]|uniref:F-box domain-containing protein n=1 Tax=Jaapia argillacea MUCL 33604 TaxID=933084 RepID=A0A067PY13_9AGAM|nr:hypothetical protein JAAARDRAFT_48484 [Jaapia argillacea MUCL 33604]